MSDKSDKKKIYKPKPISGYPEWLPQVRRVEQQWLDHIRKVFESYGFCNIETPAVEALEVIAAKGEDVDKEIYVLERLQADNAQAFYSDEPQDLNEFEVVGPPWTQDGRQIQMYAPKPKGRLALHFDQTVPLARYVGQHFNDLVFPFKRYQMQKVWRGERPQAGRFREFMQCDIDVINADNLPLSFDAEMPKIIHEVLTGLDSITPLPPFQIRISNRKILAGKLLQLGIENEALGVLSLLDKTSKLGENFVTEVLKKEYKLEYDQFMDLLNLQKVFGNVEEIKKIKAQNLLMHDGIEELIQVMDQLSHLPNVVADLSIVRGLDYYTGTVYETMFVNEPSYGSICSGGRYDNLASSYINKSLPGVGISIGFSRLFAKMQGQLEASRISPADVLVILNSEDDRAAAAEIADTLRKNGNAVELYHAPQKFSKQMSYAEKKGIPFVWMPPFGDTTVHEVKDMATGNQTKADPKEWKADD